MKTDLYKLIERFRGEILVEVQTLNSFMFVKVNKGDFLNQIASRGIDLTEMDADEKFGSGVLYVSKRYP